jgi:phosphoglycolate phosphatase
VVLQGKRLVFVTNNSTKSRAGYLGKFTGLGLNVNAVRWGGYAAALVSSSILAHLVPFLMTPCAYHVRLPSILVHLLLSLLVPQEEIYSSSYAAAAYLESIGFDKKVNMNWWRMQAVACTPVAAVSYGCALTHTVTHTVKHTVTHTLTLCTHPQVYVIGETGILEELDLKGIQHLGGPQDGTKVVNLKPGEAMEHDPEVGAPAAGLCACVCVV